MTGLAKLANFAFTSRASRQGNCIRYVRRVELLSDHLPIKNIGQNNVAKLVHHFYGNPISPDFLL